ncbi:MAG: hypothetical protein HC884_00660 [Chloroflexaceae bacterium]|nr:hypothetical protein [Chloroflexaceae bacterium]
MTGVLLYLVVFAAHAWLFLSHPSPLDYGEGPLLAQVRLLRSGTPVWQLYGNPNAPPYMVVNYPPLYLLTAAVLSWFTGSVLLAGRVVSLLAVGGSVVALVVLSSPETSEGSRRFHLFSFLHRWIMVLLLLSIPIVREWSVVMRVDMLGVGLGLWGLVALRHQRPVLAGVLLLLSLYTKPSLLAAPLAGVGWLILEAVRATRSSPSNPTGLRAWRAGLRFVAVLVSGGGMVFVLLQWASGGWFALHSITANANHWDGSLAWQFWAEQARLRGTLGVAGVGIVAWHLAAGHRRIVLPALYTLAGGVLAIGVGKVGAYTNYFLECYAGLVWLVAEGIRPPWVRQLPQPPGSQPDAEGFFGPSRWLTEGGRSPLQNSVLLLLVLASLLFHLPMWSATTLHRAGLVEPNPPRLAFGEHALWNDLKREQAVLAALRRVHATLVREVRAAGAPVFTDVPGIAAEAGVLARVQIFEHRQLLDQGYWDQRPVLLELANGTIPLAVIDYLGNWLTPQMVAIVRHRYAQDGALGTFDLYRPVEPGTRVPVRIPFGNQLRLNGYHLRYLGDADEASPEPVVVAGGILVVTLVWQRTTPEGDGDVASLREDLVVMLRLTDATGHVVAETEGPLGYGSLLPDDWPASTPVQHMQPLKLPATLESGSYGLVVVLRTAGNGRTLGEPQELTRLSVSGSAAGDTTEAPGFVVPAPFAEAREAWGGKAQAGVPLMPVVPFAWGRLQCFEHLCLEERAGRVRPRPIGAWLYQAETRQSNVCSWSPGAPPDLAICPELLDVWQRYGGEERLGTAVSGAFERNGWMVQWTRNARLERSPDGTSYVGLGRLGEELLALPPGERYGWPGEDYQEPAIPVVSNE